jgi:hypothetical protein
MIHLGRASQMRHVEAVEPTFDTLDSAHHCFQLPLKTQLLMPYWFGTRVAFITGENIESGLEHVVMTARLNLIRKWKASYQARDINLVLVEPSAHNSCPVSASLTRETKNATFAIRNIATNDLHRPFHGRTIRQWSAKTYTPKIAT